jgi:tetratricopeptide (TPR) repeat protein
MLFPCFFSSVLTKRPYKLTIPFMLLSLFVSFSFPDIETILAKAEDLISHNRLWDAYSLLSPEIPPSAPFLAKPLLLHAQCSRRMLFLKEAIADCNLIIESETADPKDIRSARRVRAASFLQLGDLDSAEKDAVDANDRKVQHRVARARSLLAEADQSDNEEAKKKLERLLRLAPRSIEFVLKRAEIAWAEQDYESYGNLTAGIQEEDSDLNYRRGVAALCRDDFDDAIAYFARAENGTIGLAAVTNLTRVRENIEALMEGLDTAESFCSYRAPVVQHLSQRLLLVVREAGDNEGTIVALDRIIEGSPLNMTLRWERGILNEEMENYDAALYDYNFIRTQEPGNQDAEEAYNRVFDARKDANRPDFYEDLGIRPGASQQEIQAAYKKLARVWHPDRFPKKDDKRHAHEVMRVVNTAYEVLSDPAKREAYDSGGDWESVGLEEVLKTEPTRTPEAPNMADFGL